jgi:hypothetical protein
MKRILETVQVSSVKSIRDLMSIVEGRDYARPTDTSSSLPPPNFQNDPMIQHPFKNATDFAHDNNAAVMDRISSAFGGHDVGGHTAYGQGRGTAAKPSIGGPKSSVSASDAPDLASSLLKAQEKPNIFPTPDMHKFNPSDTSFAQDHPPVDDLGGPSDLDKAPLGGKTGPAPAPIGTAAKPHPAGKPKTPGAKFDPAVQKIQYELRAKGYPVKADGILGPQTQKAIDWDRMDHGMPSAPEITGGANDYDEYDPYGDNTLDDTDSYNPYSDNTQGDFDRHSDIENIPDDKDARIAESVTFSQEESLARILQIAQWR